MNLSHLPRKRKPKTNGARFHLPSWSEAQFQGALEIITRAKKNKEGVWGTSKYLREANKDEVRWRKRSTKKMRRKLSRLEARLKPRVIKPGSTGDRSLEGWANLILNKPKKPPSITW